MQLKNKKDVSRETLAPIFNKENWCEVLPKPSGAFGNKAEAQQGYRRKISKKEISGDKGKQQAFLKPSGAFGNKARKTESVSRETFT